LKGFSPKKLKSKEWLKEKIREIAQEIAKETGQTVETILTMPLLELAALMKEHDIDISKLKGR